MKFSFEWLRELARLKEPPEKLADLLTLHLAETEIFLKQKRVIFNVDLLPNRVPDALSHLGLAREIGALLGKQFNYPKPSFKEAKKTIKSWVKVSIKSPFCRRYAARGIWQVKVKPSPQWLQDRIEDCGLRPINNIIDAANYAMLLTGQPLHVFDAEKIVSNQQGQKEIIVRQAQKGEQIITLDDQLCKFKESHLLICDRKAPLAIAGIKGGTKAEVDKNTRFIILESANFDGVNIRSTSRDLELRTDASWRFEHDLNPDLAIFAVNVLAQIIQQVAGGEILKGVIDEVNCSSRKNAIPVNFDRWEKFLGWPISKREIIRKLKVLGFNLIERKDYLLVAPPLFRQDIEIAEDVMAEVARLCGFNQMPSLRPKEEIALSPRNEFWEFKEKIKDWLKAYHLEETRNYSLISQKDKEFLAQDWRKKLIALANPLSSLFCYLRPTLLVNFLKNIKSNFRFIDQVRFFEIGKIYYRAKKVQEEFVFSGVLARKEKTSKTPLFYEAKGIVEGLLADFGIDKDDYSTKPVDQTEYSQILDKGIAFYFKNQLLGILASPQKNLLKNYDIEGEIIFWEIKLSILASLERAEREYEPLPQYPAVIRDISFIIPKNILVDTILAVIHGQSKRQTKTESYLEDADLFDIYEGENLPLGMQSISFHLVFRSSQKTLTAKEVEREMDKIYKALKELGAKIR